MSSLTKPGNGSAKPESATPEPSSPEFDRAAARSRLERKRKFAGDVAAYIVINAFFVVIWAVSGHGGFWPGWVIGGWGVLVLLDAWSLYFRRPITAADIDRELHRRR